MFDVHKNILVLSDERSLTWSRSPWLQYLRLSPRNRGRDCEAASLKLNRSRIHERTISSRLLGIFLGFLRREVSVYNVFITNQFQTTFAQGVGRVK